MFGTDLSSLSARNLLADFKTVLLELDLSWNLIRQNCAVDVFEGLRVNRRLQVLNICWNGLGSDLAMHKLGDALKVCTHTRPHSFYAAAAAAARGGVCSKENHVRDVRRHVYTPVSSVHVASRDVRL